MGSSPATVQCIWDGEGTNIIRVRILYLLMAVSCLILFCRYVVAMFLPSGSRYKRVWDVIVNVVQEGILMYG